MKKNKEDLVEKAKSFLSGFRFKRQDGADEVEVNGKTIARSFRIFDFYESRPSEEDDDSPNFTGEKEIRALITSAMPEELKGCELYIEDTQEKSWFSVSIRVK